MNLRSFLKFGLSFGLCISALHAQNLEPAPGIKPAPVDPKEADVPDVPGLPNVLLIGDSISGYYLPYVRSKLAGRANVHHPSENCGPTERGVAHLDQWLGTQPWAIIHFNFGLHDIKYLDAKGKYVTPDKGTQVASPEVYRKQLLEITLRLKKTGAKLVFATTTPVPPGAVGRLRKDVPIYNAIALEIMREQNVPVDDLWGYVTASQLTHPPHSPAELQPPRHKIVLRPGEIQRPFDVHFTDDGWEQLSDLVVASILPLLPSPATAD